MLKKFIFHIINFFKIIDLTPFIILLYWIGCGLLARKCFPYFKSNSKISLKKGTLIFFCFLGYNVLFSAFTFGTLIASGRVVEKKARNFCKKLIMDFKEEYVDEEIFIEAKEKKNLKEIINEIKGKDFKIEFYDFFYAIWEYEIIVDSKKYLFGIEETPFPLFRIIFNPNFKLKKIIEKKNKL